MYSEQLVSWILGCDNRPDVAVATPITSFLLRYNYIHDVPLNSDVFEHRSKCVRLDCVLYEHGVDMWQQNATLVWIVVGREKQESAASRHGR